MKKYILFILIPLFFVNCTALTGEEIARIPIKEVSTENNIKMQEVSLDLKALDEVSVWSDMDFEWDKKVELRFIIEVLKNGEEFEDYEINPIEKSVTYGEAKTEMFGAHKWHFFGKNLQIRIEEDANYTFKIMLVASNNPSLIINRADIVLMK